EACAANVWNVLQTAGIQQFDCLHVWQRDLYEPGSRGYEPGPTELAAAAEQAIRAADRSGQWAVVSDQSQAAKSSEENSSAGGLSIVDKKTRFEPLNAALPGQLVLDFVIVESNEWWLGYHRASSIASRWPGGIYPLELPADAVSRAYLKME